MTRIGEAGASGFTLLELSIATTIFSMGLSGMALLLLSAIHGTSEAQARTLSHSDASSMAELIMMNSSALNHYVNPPGDVSPSCFESSCTREQMAGTDLSRWQSQLVTDLPAGSGIVCRDSTPHDGAPDDPACDGLGGAVVKVFWVETRRPEENDTGARSAVVSLPW
jgi:type IV pilus assembly protein PilV